MEMAFPDPSASSDGAVAKRFILCGRLECRLPAILGQLPVIIALSVGVAGERYAFAMLFPSSFRVSGLVKMCGRLCAPTWWLDLPLRDS